MHPQPPSSPPDLTVALTIVRMVILLLPIVVMGILQAPRTRAGKLVALIVVTLVLAVASNLAALTFPDLVAQVLRVAASASLVVLCMVVWPRRKTSA